jgi:secretion/DNA translocation related TadE-like protein
MSGRRSGERGSAAVLGTVFVGVLLMVSLLVAVVGGAVTDRRRVASAADLAALAGAQALQAGGAGCRTARATARRNGAELTACVVSGAVLSVRAARSSVAVLGHRFTVRSAARAGPADAAAAGSRLAGSSWAAEYGRQMFPCPACVVE